ncbi:MAG: TonB family protein [Caldimonas sp.]
MALAWALLQVREVRDAVAAATPVFVNFILPEKTPEIVPPAPPPPVPVPLPKRPPPRLVTAAPKTISEVPPAFVAPPPEPSPAAPVAVETSAVVEAPAPAPPPAPAPQPKIIPASAVQYLEPISLDYPRASRRLRETGRVMLRVRIDEAGRPQSVQVQHSSGHPRLDDAALAAVQRARFQPYTENGHAVAGWAFIPIDFELEP